MAAALLVAVPSFQYVLRSRTFAKPLCAAQYSLPNPQAKVDTQLVAGGLLFGAGWGISGLCPGPAIVALAAPQVQTIAFVATMFGGWWLKGVWDKVLKHARPFPVKTS